MRSSLYSLLALLTTVSSWSGDGHRIVVDLALQLMNEHSHAYLTAHLGSVSEKTVSRASVWADTDEAKTEYPGSEAFHFSNTPYRNCQPFNYRRDCGFGRNEGICIVTGLSEAISASFDINRSPKERTEALKFVLHLMADVHQPLHTGFRADSGGNRLMLGTPKNTSLHEVWDSIILNELGKKLRVSGWKPISNRIRETVSPFDDSVLGSTNISSTESLISYVSDIVTETVMGTTCRFGYTDEVGRYIGVGEQLGTEYFESRFAIVENQLRVAAIRLAALIDRIAAEFFERTTTAKHAAAVARAEKLFAEKVREAEARAARTYASPNPFAEFGIDMNTDEIGEGAALIGYRDEPRIVKSAAPKKPSTRDRKKAVSSEDDDELLASALAERAGASSYIFNGIDLSQIVLFRKLGRLYVVDRSRVSSKSWVPRGTIERTIMTGSGDSLKRTIYLFDLNTFRSIETVTSELVLRCALKFAGIDPRIDLTDYFDGELERLPSSMRVVEPSVSPDLMALKAAHQARSTELQARIRAAPAEYTVEARLALTRGRIFEYVHGKTRAYILRETLISGTDWMRMNVLRAASSAVKSGAERVIGDLTDHFVHVLVDPDLYDYSFTSAGQVSKFMKMLEKTAIRGAEPRVLMESHRPTFPRELDGIDYYNWFRMRKSQGHNITYFGERRAAIDEVFEYAHSNGGMTVLEWSRSNRV
jgi:hypothetical protein